MRLFRNLPYLLMFALVIGGPIAVMRDVVNKPPWNAADAASLYDLTWSRQLPDREMVVRGIERNIRRASVKGEDGTVFNIIAHTDTFGAPVEVIVWTVRPGGMDTVTLKVDHVTKRWVITEANSGKATSNGEIWQMQIKKWQVLVAKAKAAADACTALGDRSKC